MLITPFSVFTSLYRIPVSESVRLCEEIALKREDHCVAARMMMEQFDFSNRQDNAVFQAKLAAMVAEAEASNRAQGKLEELYKVYLLNRYIGAPRMKYFLRPLGLLERVAAQLRDEAAGGPVAASESTRQRLFNRAIFILESARIAMEDYLVCIMGAE